MADGRDERVSADRLSLRWPIGCLFALHGLDWALERWGDGSPGMGFAVLFIGVPAFLTFLVAWVAQTVRAFRARKPRLGYSRLTGPILSLAAVVGLSTAGLPPWRFRFEVMRPFYWVVAQLSEAPAGRRHVDFVIVDKELWSGHETFTISYDPDAVARAAQTAHIPFVCLGDTAVTRTDLHWGFIAVRRQTSYDQVCE